MYMKPKVNELLIPEDIFEGITIDGHADNLGHVIKAIWAATCDFQQCGILTNVDSDELVQPHFRLRNSK